MDGVNKFVFFFCVIFFLDSHFIVVHCEQSLVHSFDIDNAKEGATRRLSSGTRSKRSITRDEVKCEKEKENFRELTEKLKKGERWEETHTFVNESKFNLALAWAGSNDNGHLIALTTEHGSPIQRASTLWRSENHGRDWTDISDLVDHEHFRKSDGLQRNPHKPDKVYLIGDKHFIYFTDDGGKTWKKREFVDNKVDQSKFSIDEMLEFHSLPDYEDYVAVISNERTLYVTYDNFRSSVEPVKRSVHSAKWGTHVGREKSLYVTTGEFKSVFQTLMGDDVELMTLERYDNGVWKTLLSGVELFNVQGKFVYASKFKSDRPNSKQDDRLMMISSDGGDTWKEAQLPTVTNDRFYSVMDMSEDLIFMHVDSPGDTGHGTLYTSSSDGVVYSESLKNHLFPNYNTVHDFYKVKSLRGVYLASQMGTEQSIHTVITYNRGGEWKKVPRPVGVECEDKDQSEDCSLQIHNAYSIHRGIKARMPHSTEHAYGLLLVHAHVAKNLQTSEPDVYLTNDGGYTFRKVLDGPHAYEIVDSGGLLIAIPLNDMTPDTVKFSTDEGRCWHDYRFTKDTLRFTGLLTEPGGRSMTVSIWGYTVDTKKWTVNTIDFSKLVPQKCNDDDFEDWMPHTAMHKGSELEGCLLGQKEIFSRIREGSWCHNGYGRPMDKKLEKCPCTKEDYECDYGFSRKVGSDKCVRQKEIRAEDIEICNTAEGKLEKIVTLGYRLVPGDQCDLNDKKSFKPTPPKEVTFDAVCHPGTKEAVVHNEKSVKASGPNLTVLIAVIVGVVILLGSVGIFLGYRWVLLRRHKVVYRYSMLNQMDGQGGDSEFENALVRNDTLYNDTSDEEIEADNKSPERHGRGGGSGSRRGESMHGYHDDSDDDMLG